MRRKPAHKAAAAAVAPAPAPRVSRLELYICLSLAAAILVVFGSVANHDFVAFDDPHYIYENPYVQRGLTLHSIAWAFKAYDFIYWHPLTLVSHMLDVELYGLKAGGHHVTNLALHTLSTFILFFFLARVTGAVWRAGAVSMLFAVHPLHVEPVAWIAERKELLQGLCWLLAMCAYAWYTRKTSSPRRYALVIACFLLALMSKPMAVTLPFALLLLDYWPLGRPLGFALIREKIPLFAISAAGSYAAFLGQRQTGATGALYGLTLPARLSNAVLAYWRYLEQTFWPHAMAVIYPYNPAPPAWQIAAATLVLAAITVIAVLLAKRAPYATVGWLWYLGVLVPTIGIVQVGFQPGADRFTYLPLIGIFIAVVWGAGEVACRWPRQRVGAIGGSVIAILCFCSWLHVQTWSSSLTLFQHAVDVTTNNPVAEFNLAEALAAGGRFAEAVPHYRETLRDEGGRRTALFGKSQFVGSHNRLAAALFSLREYDQALREVDEALRLDSTSGAAHYNRGALLKEKGRFSEALFEFDQALRNELTPEQTAMAHYSAGVIENNNGNPKGAIAHFEQALEVKPSFSEARKNLSFALFNTGQVKSAVEHLSAVVESNPGDADAQQKLEMMKARLETR